MINFYYGLSGTFKTTTMDNILNNSIKSTFYRAFKMPSMIKYWKSIETGVFKDKIQRNNLNFAILHLCNLKNFIERELNLDLADDIMDCVMIERGITDMIFYQTNLYPEYLDSDSWIKDAVNKEMDLLPKNMTINKVLLIQKDKNFIESTVLKEPSRREVFPDIDSYLKAQEKYVDFTKKYNNITETVIIENANDYLKKLNEL